MQFLSVLLGRQSHISDDLEMTTKKSHLIQFDAPLDWSGAPHAENVE